MPNKFESVGRSLVGQTASKGEELAEVRDMTWISAQPQWRTGDMQGQWRGVGLLAVTQRETTAISPPSLHSVSLFRSHSFLYPNAWQKMPPPPILPPTASHHTELYNTKSTWHFLSAVCGFYCAQSELQPAFCVCMCEYICVICWSDGDSRGREAERVRDTDRGPNKKTEYYIVGRSFKPWYAIHRSKMPATPAPRWPSCDHVPVSHDFGCASAVF